MSSQELAPSIRLMISKMHRMLVKQIKIVDNLSISEVTTLANLYRHQSLYPSQMAEMLNIKAQSMSQIINHLSELNFIEKTNSETDKRKVAISLSARGTKLVEDSRCNRDEWLTKAIEATLSASEKQSLSKAIELLEKVADYQP